MATWNSRGLRGSSFEEFLNRTNEMYSEQGLALIQKIPTPITPIAIDKESRRSEEHTSELQSPEKHCGLYRRGAGDPGLF